MVMSSARPFPHTLTYESKALDDVRAKAGLIMLGITLMIFRGKLDLKSQVEQGDSTNLSRAVQH